ncbi:MAG: rubrerythrin family protein [Candidatus Bathyarchaeota archaeon]|jgi:rubrerythrin|nr:rubrerythrin family protein [Candidatus Bathyarchaeota archaeon]
MSKDSSPLYSAFADEAQAASRFRAYAKKAMSETQPQIATLFRALAAAEMVHTANHLRNTGEIRSTRDNLARSINEETHAAMTLYPQYRTLAQKEGNMGAEWSLSVATQVERIHVQLLQQALQALQDQRSLPNVEYYVCQVCGHTIQETAPDKCPICMAPRAQYLLIK